jgi:DNA phosphorothioation-associated putative methyltransferase
LRECLRSELEQIWKCALELGRLPDPEELPVEALEALTLAHVTPQRAISMAGDEAFAPDALEQAAAARRGDLLVHLALSVFPGAPRYRSLPKSLQRDVRAFFGSLSAALEKAKALLYSTGDANVIRAAVESAVGSGLGGMCGADMFRFQVSSLCRLPIELRVRVGCAEILDDVLSSSHFVDLRISQPRLTFITCVDPFARVPVISERTKIDLGRRSVYVDDRPDRVLYLKSRFLAHDDSDRIAQSHFDEQVLAMGVIGADGKGPDLKVLAQLLEEHNIRTS